MVHTLVSKWHGNAFDVDVFNKVKQEFSRARLFSPSLYDSLEAHKYIVIFIAGKVSHFRRSLDKD